MLLALSAAAPLLLACVSQRSAPHPELARVWKSFLALPETRALAIAGDPRRDNWVTGASGGHASRDEALNAALAECGRRRAERRMQAACRPYAVGAEIVWSGP